MANPEHLDILKQGVEVWNTWRKEHPKVRPDLGKADLAKTDLAGASLREVNLTGADLHESNLTGANLLRANLKQANLGNVSLSDASCSGVQLGGATLTRALLLRANFYAANLSNANLRGADLTGANLAWAILTGANLEIAWFQETVFGNTDLKGAIGLETCSYAGPNTLDYQTIIRSGPDLPVEFLRGSGLSDWQIEAARLNKLDLTTTEVADIQDRMFELRVGRPLQVHNLFISYSHQDAVFVNHLEPEFKRRGIRYWRDVHDAPAGRLEKIVVRAMHQNPTVLLVLSKHSTQSDWVEFEVRKARELEKELKRDVLCPVTLDDSWKTCRWPERLRQQITEYNILDFSNWEDTLDFTDKFDRLVEGLHLFYEPGGRE